MVGGDADSVALAATLMLTFPGAPCIYYGDEIGMHGGHDPGCRAGFPWDRREDWNQNLLGTFRDLIAVRAARPELRHGEYRTLSAEGDLYVFSRETDAGGVAVAVNAGNNSATAELDGVTITDQLWGEGSSQGPNTVSVPGRSATIWSMTR